MSFLSITIRWTFFQSFLPKKSFGRFAQSYLVIFKELLSYRSTPLKVKPSLSLDLFLKSKAAHKELSPTHCQAFFSTFLTFFKKVFQAGNSHTFIFELPPKSFVEPYSTSLYRWKGRLLSLSWYHLSTFFWKKFYFFINFLLFTNLHTFTSIWNFLFLSFFYKV